MHRFRRMLLGLTTGAAVVLGGASCARDSWLIDDIGRAMVVLSGANSNIDDNYSINHFQRALDVRWERLSAESKMDFAERWKTFDYDIRKKLIEIYENPRSFNPDVSSVDYEDIMAYGRDYPWLNPDRPSFDDMILVRHLESVRYNYQFAGGE